LQLYSGLVFRGVGLVGEIKRELVDFLRVGRFDSLAQAVGRDAAVLTGTNWPEL
jgi:dihydroorotate dehydrogenase